ncbi:MAG TPA: cell division protein SepF [Egibacteraceae bacterium]|nr:cell division protein SepF [Egibacteraceae bacterium]
MWKRTLAYLGLVEDYEDEYADLPPEEPQPARSVESPVRSEPSNVRRISPPRSAEPEPLAQPSSAVRPVQSAKVHVTNPTTFNDVEEVGERFRNGIPVIMNLAGASEATAKRLLDFASGLIYGLEGRIERVGERVFLLTPLGVDVSSEERRKLGERGFFNQA